MKRDVFQKEKFWDKVILQCVAFLNFYFCVCEYMCLAYECMHICVWVHMPICLSVESQKDVLLHHFPPYFLEVVSHWLGVCWVCPDWQTSTVIPVSAPLPWERGRRQAGLFLSSGVCRDLNSGPHVCPVGTVARLTFSTACGDLL